MPIKYEAVAVQRYEKNGEEKKRYIRCGTVFEGARGLSLKVDSLPIGFDGWLQFYEPKPKDSPAEEPAAADGPPSDDVPF